LDIARRRDLAGVHPWAETGVKGVVAVRCEVQLLPIPAKPAVMETENESDERGEWDG